MLIAEWHFMPIEKGHRHRDTVTLYIFPLRLTIPIPSKYPTH